MPSSSLPPSSPSSSPSRATDELLELAQQLTPSKPPDILRRIRRNIQSRANEPPPLHVHKKLRKRLNRAAHADNSIANPHTVEERTREKGRHFVVEEALFLVDPDMFTVDEDEDFDISEEFTSDKNRIQGQLRQIMRYLPDDIKHLRKTNLISGAFIDGMSGQRSNTSNRLRVASLANIVDDVKPFETSASRFNAFAKLIGYQPGTDTRDPYYSKLDVPILYDNWQGQKDLNSFLRGPILLKIHASIIRGPNGAVGLFSGKSKRPSAKTVEKMYKIHHTALGAISNSASLAIWMHSADTQLTEIGDETGINYRERQIYYLQRILDGLANDKAWALDLVAYWDRILFPDADAPQNGAGSAGNQRLEAGEDEDDFFDSAPAAEHPPTPTCPATRLSTPPPLSPNRSSAITPPPRPHRSAPSDTSHSQSSRNTSPSPGESIRHTTATSGDRDANRRPAAASLLTQRRR
ncbi:hypothetical protein MVEN_02645000 [Mycena venus]|uniref:Uncharacterized protein n=1 Tax=Mycena venus TaxID=2733690 RepID=A0A8H6WP18_9AGAR|nr:hypothetical protein MVEN_02645000 [Mycena venus]